MATSERHLAHFWHKTGCSFVNSTHLGFGLLVSLYTSWWTSYSRSSPLYSSQAVESMANSQPIQRFRFSDSQALVFPALPGHKRNCSLAPGAHLWLWGSPSQLSDLSNNHLPIIFPIRKSKTMLRQSVCLPTDQIGAARRVEHFNFFVSWSKISWKSPHVEK